MVPNPVSLEQESEATICTDLLKLSNSKIGKTLSGLKSLDFSCDILVVGSKYGKNNMKGLLNPARKCTMSQSLNHL